MRLLIAMLILWSCAQVSAQEAASTQDGPDGTRDLAQIDTEFARLEIELARLEIELARLEIQLALEASAEGLHRRGLCLVQLDRLPEALVAFRRALLRRPSDPVIEQNLRLVERRLGIVRAPETSWDARLRERLSALEPLTALGLLVLIEVAGLAFVVFGARRRRFMAAGVLLLCCFILGAAAYRGRFLVESKREAVVLFDHVVLRAEPSESQTALRELGVGQVVVVEKGSADWLQVLLGARRGYLKRAEVGLVD